MHRCSDSPEDQVICLFAGLFDNPDVPLSPNNMSPGNSRTKLVDLKIKLLALLQDHLQNGEIEDMMDTQIIIPSLLRTICDDTHHILASPSIMRTHTHTHRYYSTRVYDMHV